MAVTRRPAAAASRALPPSPQARSATGPSGSPSDNARAASGCGSNDTISRLSYLAFHRSSSGCPASSAMPGIVCVSDGDLPGHQPT